MDAPLNFDRHANAALEQRLPEQSGGISEIVEQLTGFVRRQFAIFAFVIPCCLALGVVYLMTTPGRYTSSAMLLIDSSKLRVLQQQQAPIGDVPIDAAQVETQVEILKSENIGLSVIKDLKLADDPEFAGSGGGILGKIWNLFSLFESQSDAQSETQSTRKALRTFLAKRSVSRVARTYVLDIAFTSFDPVRAATIANAIADAYIVDQLEAKYQATRRAGAWLQDRIKELRQQASDADRAVLDYKEKNKIVDVGKTPSGDTRLLAEQQLEELNTQLGSARAAAEEAKAKLERVDEIVKKGVPDATVADSLRNEVITRLRNSYLEIGAKEAIWSARYGSNHLAAVNLRTQMAELRRAILDELGRIAQGYKSDYEIAKSRVDALERNLESLVSNKQSINRDRLGLTDLESTAKVYHTIYDNFLQRYMEAIQQQSFPITEARVISVAAPPQRKSGPLAHIVLGLAGLMGVMLSIGIAVMREAIDRVFRTTRDLENTLQTNCLAVVPRLNPPAGSMAEKARKTPAILDRLGSVIQSNRDEVPLAVEADTRVAQSTRVLAKFPELQSSLSRNSFRKDGGGPPAATGNRRILREDAFMRQVVAEPLSAFAEAFRSIKVAADILGARGNNKVIGVTSAVPGEGKSTVSSNFAQGIAHAGKRVILVDGDLRNPSISRALAPKSQVGLLQVLRGEVALDEAIFTDEETGLRFLPSFAGSRPAHTNEILASDGFSSLIRSLSEAYDYVIIDLPPLAPVVDVRVTTQIIDSFVFVVEWGKTPKNVAQHQLFTAPEVHERLLGAVLNKADVGVLERYEAQYGRYYYGGYYGSNSSHSS